MSKRKQPAATAETAAESQSAARNRRERELEDWIESSARYLQDLALRERFYSRPSIASLEGHPDRHLSHHDFDGFMVELLAIEHDLDAACRRLNALRGHFSFGRLQPFDAVHSRIEEAGRLSSEAWASVRIAQNETRLEHPPKTRKLSLQQSATRLAFGAVGGSEHRRARDIAKRIMQKAGLQEPDEKTISNWIRELKNEEIGK